MLVDVLVDELVDVLVDEFEDVLFAFIRSDNIYCSNIWLEKSVKAV